MSTALKIGGGVLLIALIIGAGFAGAQVAAAQQAITQQTLSTPGIAPFGPMMGGNLNIGPGFRSGPMLQGWMIQHRDQINAAMAQALGMTTDEFNQALAAGKTPWQIAQEKGMSVSDFNSKMADAMAGVLKQAVADGRLTQAQADAIIAQMKQGYGPGMMGGYGPGMMWGYGPGMMRGVGPGGEWRSGPWRDRNRQ